MCLCFAGQERNSKWAASCVASNCTTLADSVQKLLASAIISKRSEWMEAMSSTIECLQHRVSDSVRLGEKKAQEVSQKLHKAHQSELQKKESEITEARKTARSASVQADDLTSQLNLALLREGVLKQDFAQCQEKVDVLEKESQLAAQHHQDEIAQLKQSLLAAEDKKKTLFSEVQQLQKQLLERKQLNISLEDDSDRETPSRQPPALRVESQS